MAHTPLNPLSRGESLNNGLLIYRELGTALSKGTATGYKRGVADVVKLTKKKVLRLTETTERTYPTLSYEERANIFKVSYTGVDKELLKNFQVEAFTVAAIHNYEAEEKLKALASSLMDGTHPLLQSNPEQSIDKLWQAEAYNILADYIEVPDAPPPAVLTTNLRTAVNSAYHGAQWTKLQDVTDVLAYYQYKTREDNRVREEHAVLDNLVASAKDPIWQKIWPPNGWNCRCYVNPLTLEEYLLLKGSPLTGPPEADLRSASRGKILDMADEEMRAKLLKEASIEKDFNRNSGDTGSIWGKWIQTKLKEVDLDKVREQMKVYAENNRTEWMKGNYAETPSAAVNEANEVWGNFVKPGITKINFLKYRGNIIQVQTDDGKNIFDDAENINNYRQGVLMNLPLSARGGSSTSLPSNEGMV